MKTYGVIGKPIGHTFSPDYFRTKFVREGLIAEYNAYEVKDVKLIRSLVLEEGLSGFNVTIPFKQTIIKYLDALDDAAAAINAVNSVSIDNGKLKGYNTDWIGFLRSIAKHVRDNSKALLFGTGGSSKAVKYALNKLGVPYDVVSTREGIGFDYKDVDAKLLKDYHLVVNTTPLGLAPKINQAPEINYSGINEQHLCYDLIYNPEKTLFLKQAEENGATIMNGYEMLTIQADIAWSIWNQ